MVEFWVITHFGYALVTSDKSADLKPLREDSRWVFVYVLLCCSVFSMSHELHVAFGLSCVIAIFYVFCETVRRVFAVILHEDAYWPTFVVMNFFVISTVIYLYLILKTYGS